MENLKRVNGLWQESANSCWKDQRVNILDFAVCMVSIPTTQFCGYSREAAVDNM